jgi:hypothetical protein
VTAGEAGVELEWPYFLVCKPFTVPGGPVFAPFPLRVVTGPRRNIVISKRIAMLGFVALAFLASLDTIESQSCTGWFDPVARVCDSMGD